MEQIKKRSNCPVSSALDVVGDKWTLLIVRDISFSEKQTYGQFLESDEGIATNILASRLRTLINIGIVKKTPNPADRRKEFYSLTQKGTDLIPVLIELILWSAKHDPKKVISKEIVNQARKLKESLQKTR